MTDNTEHNHDVEQAVLNAEVALKAFRNEAHDNDEEILIDLLADIQHLCDAKDLDYVSIEALATTHYLSEV